MAKVQKFSTSLWTERYCLSVGEIMERKHKATVDRLERINEEEQSGAGFRSRSVG